MRKTLVIFITLICLVMLLTGCSELGLEEFPSLGQVKGPMRVSVMLQQTEGMTVVSENPLYVKPGEDASFSVQIQDGYKLVGLSDGATYEDGTVTLSAVRFPTTLEAETRLLNYLELAVVDDGKQGKLQTSVALGTVREDTEVTLSVTPKEGTLFLGYSVGGTREQGGTIVATSAEYTFSMTENVTLFTNYYRVGKGRLVVYDSNGGKESPQYYVFLDNSPFIGPNALANKGQFTRDGYVLYGYNTRPDGSGTYYGPGWSMIIPEDKNEVTTLYAQWLPVTEKEAFTYKVSGKKVTITRYKGDHDTVVIPETIDGMPVVAIAANAFLNGKFTTLYLSRNLKTVENQAFMACKSLKNLYFCDTPSTISDASFSHCDNLQTLYMLACMDPRYSTSNNGTYKIKYQRLISAQGKKIIFHAGSNVSYGVDIKTMQNELGGEYAGVNFGCNVSTPAVFYVEVASAYMNPGDILVLCPEISAYQFGQNDLNATTWQIFEGAYNAFADVDIRHFTEVFTSFATFNINRYSSSAKTYEAYNTASGAPSVDKYGVFNINHYGQTSAMKEEIAKYTAAGGYGSLAMSADLLAKDYTVHMNEAIDLVLEKGGKVYFSFAATMRIVLNKYSQTAAVQKTYKEAVVKAFPKATVISDPGTYVMESNWFYNSRYHLSTDGSVHRAKLLAKDILAQLAKEK